MNGGHSNAPVNHVRLGLGPQSHGTVLQQVQQGMSVVRRCARFLGTLRRFVASILVRLIFVLIPTHQYHTVKAQSMHYKLEAMHHKLQVNRALVALRAVNIMAPAHVTIRVDFDQE
eukprot:COSAG06_NODE_98_length_24155_cov_29.681784_15_plen_116_part_00